MGLIAKLLAQFKKPTVPNSIELVELKRKELDQCAGFFFEVQWTLIIKVNGRKKKAVYTSDKLFKQDNFKSLFSQALGTGETYFKARERYTFITSDKFKSGHGIRFI